MPVKQMEDINQKITEMPQLIAQVLIFSIVIFSLQHFIRFRVRLRETRCLFAIENDALAL